MSETGTPASVTNQFGTDPEGLGRELNIKIAEFLQKGNYLSLLDIIRNYPDKDKACEVVLNSMFQFHQKDRADSINSLVRTALHEKNIATMEVSLKALISYSYRNNLTGERFFRNPNCEEILLLDQDGEVISFKGEVATIQKGLQGADKNYVSRLDSYTVLTGPNKGKVFSGKERPIPQIE